ncbi:ATP-independent RNA helicase [Indibacter alkaliphilus LW1]|uniref:ATP-independent RNA helicase n=1 Tax=Indibacter alkaliphilus (strain CCUG 57479 / KCTC 22604 / LW1) TaxID=1189612 RepID=S2D6Z4_INDAL|nr:DEAD/DEAH box helicase [Indibacter alkaliphilus]EOZ92835.1 ATP-independent RNA helicase [Indibacter alkaliphilus LW1]
MEKGTKDLEKQFLSNLEIEGFNEMQLAFIEAVEKHPNVMLLAPTGSGKTLAFLFPLFKLLDPTSRSTQALVIVPSRELAIQIEQVFKSLKTGFRVSTCYGGHSMKLEKNSLGEFPDVVIGTPGRLSDHVNQGSLETATIQLVVLDEFDKSLQLGFHDQLRDIFRKLTGGQKHFLTSATQMGRLPEFIPFDNPPVVDFLFQNNESRLELKLVSTSSKEKVQGLMRLISQFQGEAGIVFCNHREAVERISLLLNDHGYNHAVLHGGMEQLDREKNLIKFRSGVVHLLIATDLASRGLDIPEIKHIIHYQLPPKQDAFTHRNGRTARMHASGQGYLVLANDEVFPDYLDERDFEEAEVGSIVPSEPSEFALLYLSAGKKDKISKGDIAGFLIKVGGLQAAAIGLITLMDFASYVAVECNDVTALIKRLNGEKLKKNKVKVAEAN